MKVKIFTAEAGQPCFYNDTARALEWHHNMGEPEEKSYQDVINDFLNSVKPIQVFVSEDPLHGFLITTIVYKESEE